MHILQRLLRLPHQPEYAPMTQSGTIRANLLQSTLNIGSEGYGMASVKKYIKNLRIYCKNVKEYYIIIFFQYFQLHRKLNTKATSSFLNSYTMELIDRNFIEI